MSHASPQASQYLVVAPKVSVSDFKDAVVQIDSPAGRGSGFWVSPRLVVTCAHVVSAALHSEAVVKIAIPSYFDLKLGNSAYANWTVLKSKVVALDQANDLALLETEQDAPTTAFTADVPGRVTLRAHATMTHLETTQPEQLSTVFLAGFPLGNPYVIVQPGTTAAMTGSLSIAGLPGNTKLLFNTVANHGNSGGPIFNPEGRVVAVLEGALPSVPNATDSALAVSGLAVGIPAFYVEKMVAGYKP